MMRVAPLLTAAAVLAAVPLLQPAPARASVNSDVDVTLSGSRASMLRQNSVAKQELFSFLRTTAQVEKFVESGYLVRLDGNSNYHVIAGHPFARPVVRSFIERLSADYQAACGERLVVTSLTRPATRQPSNASPLSVHPAGMAVDLRVSSRAECREWLSDELLSLEARGLLDATREYRPPHFHIAVFPAYEAYDHTLTALETVEEATRLIEEAAAARAAADQAAAMAAFDAASQVAAPMPPSLLLRVAVFMVKLVLPLHV